MRGRQVDMQRLQDPAARIDDGSIAKWEMRIDRRKAMSAELGQRAARENFALYATGVGLGKRELLLEGLPHGARIVVIAPVVLVPVWKERIARRVIGAQVRTYSREYARTNPIKVARELQASPCDYLIVEEPQGEKTCRRLAQIAIKAPRTIVIGFGAGWDLPKQLDYAATVLGVAPAAMPVVLLTAGSNDTTEVSQ